MKHFDFIWTDLNTEYIAEHGVTPDEVVDVVCDPEFTSADRRNGRQLAFGETFNGKFLKVVYELIDKSTVYVITAFEVEP